MVRLDLDVLKQAKFVMSIAWEAVQKQMIAARVTLVNMLKFTEYVQLNVRTQCMNSQKDGA